MPTIPKLVSIQPPLWYKQIWCDKYNITDKLGSFIHTDNSFFIVGADNREMLLHHGDFCYSYSNLSNARFTRESLEQIDKWQVLLKQSKQPRSRWMNWRNIRVNENYIDAYGAGSICYSNRIIPMFVLMCGLPEFSEHNLLTLYLTAYAAANAKSLGRNHFAEDFAGIPAFEGRMLMPTHNMFTILEQHPESIVVPSVAPRTPPLGDCGEQFVAPAFITMGNI